MTSQKESIVSALDRLQQENAHLRECLGQMTAIASLAIEGDDDPDPGVAAMVETATKAIRGESDVIVVQCWVCSVRIGAICDTCLDAVHQRMRELPEDGEVSRGR